MRVATVFWLSLTRSRSMLRKHTSDWIIIILNVSLATNSVTAQRGARSPPPFPPLSPPPSPPPYHHPPYPPPRHPTSSPNSQRKYTHTQSLYFSFAHTHARMHGSLNFFLQTLKKFFVCSKDFVVAICCWPFLRETSLCSYVMGFVLLCNGICVPM